MKHLRCFSFLFTLPFLLPAQTREASKIVALNRQIDEAVVSKDLSHLKAWYADDFVFTHGTGLVDNKTSWLKTVGDTSLHYISRTHDSLTTEMHGKVALLRGKLTVHRKSKTGVAAYELWYVRVFVLRKRQWQLISHRTTAERHLN